MSRIYKVHANNEKSFWIQYIGNWYFVLKNFLTYCGKKKSSYQEKCLKTQGWEFEKCSLLSDNLFKQWEVRIISETEYILMMGPSCAGSSWSTFSSDRLGSWPFFLQLELFISPWKSENCHILPPRFFFSSFHLHFHSILLQIILFCVKMTNLWGEKKNWS